jgi:hypothetical protein
MDGTKRQSLAVARINNADTAPSQSRINAAHPHV